ncbi:MAG TPA: hypothetical protein VLA61_15600 [Ideonella sp.]|nr:hypothetical protein [Ideonella sp.]HSI49697.1 hypothetical protein [Ideonella sp.]
MSRLVACLVKVIWAKPMLAVHLPSCRTRRAVEPFNSWLKP